MNARQRCDFQAWEVEAFAEQMTQTMIRCAPLPTLESNAR